jgi:hypothetical protein
MRLTAEEILEHLRALPPRERLRVVERTVHEVAQETPGPESAPPLGDDAIWADVDDEQYEAFLRALTAARAEPWRGAE